MGNSKCAYKQVYPGGKPKNGKRSIFEDTLYNNLKDHNKVLVIQYEAEELSYELTYVPDFSLVLASGKEIIIEAKGYFTPEDRTKMLRVKRLHPEKDIRLVFMNNNKLHGKSNMRYGDWCDKHSFPWAIKQVPDTWLNE